MKNVKKIKYSFATFANGRSVKRYVTVKVDIYASIFDEALDDAISILRGRYPGIVINGVNAA